MWKSSSSMRRMLLCSVWIALIAAMAGCGTSDKLTTPAPGQGSTGTADFTSFVAIGNSLTAGYQSAAITKVFTSYSFPALIAAQAGVTTFVGPQVSDPGLGSYTSRGAGRLTFNIATQAIAPIPLSAAQAANPAAMLENAAYATAYNNLGIPGALSIDVVTATSSANAVSPMKDLFNIVLRPTHPAVGGKTALEQALLLDPTFATVWIGTNDVLLYALAGGVAPGLPTSTLVVANALNAVVSGLQAKGADVAIANIVNVRDIPYFTTVKPYLVDPVTGTPILHPTTQQHIPVIGPSGALSEQDMVLLTAKDSLAAGVGIPPGLPGVPSTGRPLPGNFILDATEQSTITARTAEYNNAILQAANTPGCAFVDINAAFSDIAKHGYPVGGVTLTASMVTGGIFSLDGIHPNTLGNGIVANAFIEAINEEFEAQIPLVDLSSLFNK